MSFDKDTSMIVKDLSETIDKVVSKNEIELGYLYKIYEIIGSKVEEKLNKQSLLINLLPQIESIKIENDDLTLKVLENQDSKGKISKLEDENKILHRKIIDLENSKLKQSQRITELESVERDIEFTKQEITRKNKDLNSKIVELDKCKEEIASKENLIFKLQTSNNNDSNLKEQLESNEQHKIKLEEENKSLLYKLVLFEEEANEHKFTIEELNLKLVSLSDEKFEFNKKCEQLKRNYELLNLRNESLYKENEELKAQNNELDVYKKLSEMKETELRELSLEIGKLKVDLDETKRSSELIKSEKDKIEHQVNLKVINDEFNIKEATEEREYYKDKLKTAEVILAEINRQMVEKEKIIEELKNNKTTDKQENNIEILNNKINELEFSLNKEQEKTILFNDKAYKFEEINSIIQNQQDEIKQLTDNLANMSKMSELRLKEIQELHKEKEITTKIIGLKDKDKLILQIDELVEKLEKFVV